MVSRLDAMRGQRLQAAMKHAGVSGQELAEVAAVSPGVVTGWRKGAEIRCRHLMLICPYLDISIDHLVAGVDTAPTAEVQLVRHFRTLDSRTGVAVLKLIKNLAPSV
ncbi:helix-turn-helix domain-containing protein (plasmid) [Microbulbifer sp. ANSA001]|uniref:helix-turn-helix domain-containing protein n=1 Tax=Microbulbifer sp. ANSA001 TaxID=3243358 RepID=UPI0040420535